MDILDISEMFKFGPGGGGGGASLNGMYTCECTMHLQTLAVASTATVAAAVFFLRVSRRTQLNPKP